MNENATEAWGEKITHQAFHIPRPTLQEWRQRGDPLGDGAVAALMDRDPRCVYEGPPRLLEGLTDAWRVRIGLSELWVQVAIRPTTDC
jgi:hypothetical protein